MVGLVRLKILSTSTSTSLTTPSSINHPIQNLEGRFIKLCSAFHSLSPAEEPPSKAPSYGVRATPKCIKRGRIVDDAYAAGVAFPHQGGICHVAHGHAGCVTIMTPSG